MIGKLDTTTHTPSQHWHHKNIATWADYHTTSIVLYEATLSKARQQSVLAGSPVPLKHYFRKNSSKDRALPLQQVPSLKTTATFDEFAPTL